MNDHHHEKKEGKWRYQFNQNGYYNQPAGTKREKTNKQTSVRRELCGRRGKTKAKKKKAHQMTIQVIRSIAELFK